MAEPTKRTLLRSDIKLSGKGYLILEKFRFGSNLTRKEPIRHFFNLSQSENLFEIKLLLTNDKLLSDFDFSYLISSGIKYRFVMELTHI